MSTLLEGWREHSFRRWALAWGKRSSRVADHWPHLMKAAPLLRTPSSSSRQARMRSFFAARSIHLRHDSDASVLCTQPNYPSLTFLSLAAWHYCDEGAIQKREPSI